MLQRYLFSFVFKCILSIFALIMVISKIVNNIVKIVFPLILGGAILYWMYRDFDFSNIRKILLYEMNWVWMLLSLPFGIVAQVFRGWRWKQVLEPVNERPRISVSINSIFISYAVSLLIPRIGEFARCGVLHRYDRINFPKALGTVVTERAVDTLIILLITALAFVLQIRVFANFFLKTGTRLDNILEMFTPMGWGVTAICGIAAILLLYIIFKKFSINNRISNTFSGIWQGVLSLKGVNNVPLFIFFSFAIWISYFFHYYLTFFCFAETSHLGLTCAIVSFVVGSIAVIVPTPNGAGPWHFAVKTMLILYGVNDIHALYFVLIVHTIQTFLVILLGIYAWIALSFTKKAILTNN